MDNASSFIVKIWIEEADDATERASWRGRITHVPSGEQHYLKDLAEIPAFIAPYLLERGIKLDRGLRIKLWLQRWQRRR